MKYVLSFCFLAFLACPYPAAAQMHKEWKSCEQDSDCVVVGGGCCLEAVNVASTQDGKNYCDDMNKRVECIRYMDPAKASAKCERSPIPCMSSNASQEGCLSKKAHCTVVEQVEMQ